MPALEADHPFNCRDMIETPAAKIVFEINELFREFIQLPEARGFATEFFHQAALTLSPLLTCEKGDVAFDDGTIDLETAPGQ